MILPQRDQFACPTRAYASRVKLTLVRPLYIEGDRAARCLPLDPARKYIPLSRSRIVQCGVARARAIDGTLPPIRVWIYLSFESFRAQFKESPFFAQRFESIPSNISFGVSRDLGDTETFTPYIFETIRDYVYGPGIEVVRCA